MGFGRRAIVVAQRGAADGVATLGGTGDLDADQIPVPDIEAIVAETGAATADKLKFPRSISLAGDVAGSTTFDGSANVSISAAVNDSDKVDGLQAWQFLRSDADDIKTSGYTRYNDGTSAQFGNSADLTVSHNDHHSYIQNNTGDLYIQQRLHGTGTICLQAKNSAGVSHAAIYARADSQSLYGDGVEMLRVDSDGIKVYGRTTVTGSVYCSSVFNDGGSLHLQGDDIVLAASSSLGDARIFMRSGSSTIDYGWNGHNNNFLYLQTYDNNTTTYRQTLARFGEAEIRFYSPHVQSSGANFKTVLGSVQNALETVSKLNPIFYHYNDRPAEEIQAGFVAEEVLAEVPEARIVFGEEGDLGIDYSKVGVWAIAAIKELKQRVEILEGA